jgi:hypothetical protein
VRIVRARAHAGDGPRRPRRGSRRQARLVVALADAGTTGSLAATVDVRTPSGRRVSRRTRKVKPGPLRTIALGRLDRGRYRVRLDLKDRAGNPTIVRRSIRIR